MLQPKIRKHKKEFRGKMKGFATRGTTIAYGDYALQATDRGWINGNQLEAARKAIVKETKRRGKTWLMVFPHKPITKKSDETRRGSGKGEVSGYVAVIKPANIIFEIGGLDEAMAMKALKLASAKLPIQTRIIKK
jgi:large subunit ribosomal protein L16